MTILLESISNLSENLKKLITSFNLFAVFVDNVLKPNNFETNFANSLILTELLNIFNCKDTTFLDFEKMVI